MNPQKQRNTLNALSHARRIVLFFLFLSGVVQSTKTRCERPDKKRLLRRGTMPDSQKTHTPEDAYQYTNRLIHETSPYLLQHAHNPVDWYPWGEEALQKAQREDKPILLSVGYSACHWCHVMERESFENEEIAALMNQHFVSIKVDREERPDIDSIYMQAVQAITHQGGWPMTVFLMPDGRPFYGGTYFPPSDRRYGHQVMPGFPRVIVNIATIYEQERERVEEQANEIAQYLRDSSDAPLRVQNVAGAAGTPSYSLLGESSRKLATDFDAQHGGFGSAPKFPNTMALELLLRVHQHRQKGEISEQALFSEIEIINSTLQHMAYGGIYDQLGGGFHRYSVDAEWLVPHFEKMLYDNALLSRLYLHAYLVTVDPLYERIVTETLDYVVREMTSPEGGFYSTQDADSEGEEGKFFLWGAQDIRQLLDPHDANLFMAYYDVTPRGNFEGKNILHVPRPIDEIATEAQLSVGEVQASLKLSHKVLFKTREMRVKPARDEKVLTAWNGLMLRSFAEAGRYLDRPDYLQVAVNNATFLLNKLRAENGRLLRTYKDGRARLNGYLEDYVFLADGLLALYEATFETRWFVEARKLLDEAIALFASDQQGGFFDTGNDHEALVSRPRDIMDNATPAGNSIAAEVLLKLTAFTGEQSYRQRADEYLQAIAEIAVQHPQSFGQVLCSLDFATSPVKEIAIIGHGNLEPGNPKDADTRILVEGINNHYLPNSVLACSGVDEAANAEAIALLADRPLKDGKATAYICQNFVCQAPVTTPEELERLALA
jgi:uncharacterized protein